MSFSPFLGSVVSYNTFVQDDYAVQSFERGIAAQTSGAFSWEIAPVRSLNFYYLLFMALLAEGTKPVTRYVQVEVSGGRGRPSTVVDKDEGLGKVTILSPISNTCIGFTDKAFLFMHVSFLTLLLSDQFIHAV